MVKTPKTYTEYSEKFDEMHVDAFMHLLYCLFALVVAVLIA
jgi:hypothetical protein